MIEKLFEVGTKELRLRHGDLLRSDTTAIVNSIGSKMDMSGGLSAALIEKAGEATRIECERYKGSHPLLPVGSCFSTPGGNLRSMIIIHTSCPKRKEYTREEGEELFRRTVLGCLEKAERLGCESVSLPLLGTRYLGFHIVDSARIIVDVSAKFLLLSESIQSILIFCREKPAFDLVLNALNDD